MECFDIIHKGIPVSQKVELVLVIREGVSPNCYFFHAKSFCNSGSIFKTATRFETIRSDPNGG